MSQTTTLYIATLLGRYLYSPESTVESRRVENTKTKKVKTDMLRSIGKQSGESVRSAARGDLVRWHQYEPSSYRPIRSYHRAHTFVVDRDLASDPTGGVPGRLQSATCIVAVP